jgi:hypothetical protein
VADAAAVGEHGEVEGGRERGRTRWGGGNLRLEGL